MSPEDLKDLREMGEELAASAASPWEPRSVSRAFASNVQRRCNFTMQAWIDLDHALSPLLQGQPPETLEDLEAAVRAFELEGGKKLTLSPNEAVDLAHEMLDAVLDGFGMFLKMSPPEGTTLGSDQGMGHWLPLAGALIRECGLRPLEIGPLPVGQAFALLAAVRLGKGWDVAGHRYAWRDTARSNESVEDTHG